MYSPCYFLLNYYLSVLKAKEQLVFKPAEMTPFAVLLVSPSV